MAGKNSWLLPLAAGIGIGWFFSGTLSKVLDPIATSFNLRGGNAAYAYPGNVINPAVAPGPRYVEPYERRSFDRSYDSWLHNTYNSLPTIG